MNTSFKNLTVLEKDFKRLVRDSLSAYTMIKSEFEDTVFLINVKPKKDVALPSLLVAEKVPYTATTESSQQNYRVLLGGEETMHFLPSDGIPKVDLESVIENHEKGTMDDYLALQTQEFDIISWDYQVEIMEGVDKINKHVQNLSDQELRDLLIANCAGFKSDAEIALKSGRKEQINALMRFHYEP